MRKNNHVDVAAIDFCATFLLGSQLKHKTDNSVYFCFINIFGGDTVREYNKEILLKLIQLIVIKTETVTRVAPDIQEVFIWILTIRFAIKLM